MENQPKRLLEKILEAAIIFALSAYLIKLGVCYIAQVWPVLVILATIILVGVIIYRIWKRHHDSKW